MVYLFVCGDLCDILIEIKIKFFCVIKLIRFEISKYFVNYLVVVFIDLKVRSYFMIIIINIL